MVKNIDQERAKYAYKMVKDVVENHSGLKDKYSSKAVNFPSMVLTNGLLQALLFLFSNENADDRSYQMLLSHIRGWFAPGNANATRLYACTAPTNAAFVEHVLNQGALTLRLITNETICVANWLKRFAEGMIGKGGQ